MASKHREQKVIASVACTTCGAALGEPCRLPTTAARLTAQGRLLVCSERRVAWQLIRDGAIGDDDARGNR